MTKALSPKLGEMGIRINCVAPGLIRTAFGSVLWEKNKEIGEALMSFTTMKRFGEPRMCIATNFLQMLILTR